MGPGGGGCVSCGTAQPSTAAVSRQTGSDMHTKRTQPGLPEGVNWMHGSSPLQVREQERRAEEARLAKQAADEEWRRQQHERELQRKLEEEAREREVKVGRRQAWARRVACWSIGIAPCQLSAGLAMLWRLSAGLAMMCQLSAESHRACC